MPNYIETKMPYEFLVRWDKEGKLSGEHVGFRTITKKDGVEIVDTVDPVMPVADGLREGFPLADILALVQSGFADKGAVFNATVVSCDAACKVAEAAKIASDDAIAIANNSAGLLEQANARLKAAQDESDRLEAAEKAKAEFDAAVAAAVQALEAA